MRSQDVFKNAIMTVRKDLGLLERELAVCIKIDKTVLSRFKTQPYKWTKEIDRRLVLLALLMFLKNEFIKYFLLNHMSRNMKIVR